MRKYNISANLVRTIEQLYDKATSAVQMNGSIGEWSRTTVGVRQGCLLSPTLFNIFLERIMSDALEERDGKVRIGGRNITNLRFADDIDALAEEEQELEALVESLDKICSRYKMEISAEKTKLMANSANGIQRETKVKGQKLGTVTSFKYLGAVVSDGGFKPEVLSRIERATAAFTKLKPFWRDNNISLGSKKPGRVAQSVGHLTRKSGVLGSIPGLATYFRFSFRFFQEGQLSVTGESICTKYWLTA